MNIDVPSIRDGFKWDHGFEISVEVQGQSVHIKANSAGLISLARHMLSLAQNDSPIGDHFHLDDLNSLEDGSSELIIEKA